MIKLMVSATVRIDLQPVEDRGGHRHAGLGVALDALALADVVLVGG